MKKRPVIYIAGPYRGPSEAVVFCNIIFARDMAMEVWKLGAIPLCPHLNSMLMGGVVPDQDFLDGDLVLLDRCDAVYAIRGWQQSAGAKREVEFANSKGIPVFYSESTLCMRSMESFVRDFNASK